MLLQDLVINSAAQYPEAIAIQGLNESLTYQQLNNLANRISRALVSLGVQQGDRVALWLDKSERGVAAMQGILRCGAAYVPIDPQSPALRAQSIMKNCNVRALVTTSTRANEALTGELEEVACLCVEGDANGRTKCIEWKDLDSFSADALERPNRTENDLAYILYTSGSTGQPKGVCISHLNALAFIEWGAKTIQVTPEDRLSNHAPFHFDLSVFDLYAAFFAGASVSLIPEGISYIPKRLVEFISEKKITVWYSVPSVMVMMMEHGNWLEMTETSLRAIIFAGEPFSIKHLNRLRNNWPSMRLLNWYGPTETNVCTSFEVFDIEPTRTVPVPIGTASCGDKVWAAKPDNSPSSIGEEGELMVTGPTVMIGYWGQPPQGDKPYPTGDIVKQQPDGNFVYVGRSDYMVKVRGHRIELGDIEAALLNHSKVEQAAVVVAGGGMEARLVAYLTCPVKPNPTLLEIKQHCAKLLPRYMIVDEIRFIAAPPRTSTGKLDRKKLLEVLNEPPVEAQDNASKSN